MFLIEPRRVKIRHPKADEISIIDHEYAYCGEGTSEIAFFLNGKWVTERIEPFSEYIDTIGGDTAVYGWVPNELIEAFLDENGV